jgi:hypothetical protein
MQPSLEELTEIGYLSNWELHRSSREAVVEQVLRRERALLDHFQ